MTPKGAVAALVAVALVVFMAACGDGKTSGAGGKGAGAEISGELVIFNAGSLAVPFKEIAEAFKKEHPGVKVTLETAGSRDCARKITELGRACDVMASADYAVIDSLLIPRYADWNIKFAGNEMAVVYHDRSRRAAEINRDNWYEILLDKAVAFGRSNPDADPCGYRTVLTARLAEGFYKAPGLCERLLAKDQRHIRPKETDLLALLETGEIDYIFLYRSVAVQHGLKFLTLPDEINLKRPALADRYRTAAVTVSGKEPGTKEMIHGEPMVYGVTIPRNAANPKAAEAFVSFLLARDGGMAVMEKLGQPSVVPAPCETFDKLPQSLRKFAARK